jgi:predicted Zn-dependent protease
MVVSPEFRQYGDLAQTGLGVLFLKFSRDDERQADDLGFRYLNRAGYDPHEMAEMFRVLDRVSAASGGGRLPDWLATHPNPENRVERIQQSIAASPPELLGSTVEHRAFLEEIDGVAFGPNPREGFFRGATFYHPDLAFTLRFPEGWRTENRKDAVVGVSPGEDALIALTLADAAGGADPDDAARSFFAEPSIRGGSSWRSSIGGFPAASRFFTVSREAGDLAGLVAFVRDGDRLYRLIGYTLESRASRYRSSVTATLESFEELRDRRFLEVQPKRIELVRVPRRMTLAATEAAYPSTVDLDTLAIINHVERGAILEEGTLYKRVVGGELPDG